MRSGTDYHERGPDSPHFQLNALLTGWDRFVLSRPMVRDPGTFFQYDSGGVILMSSMIKARTGDHADVLIAEYIFGPLGIDRCYWHKNFEGHPHTGGGLMLRPRDMAKFGLLYLRKGKWEDRQIVPASWVEASTRRHAAASMPDGRTTDYGYLWWILRPDPDGRGDVDIWAACGFRAQYIFVVPEHDMVVVVTGGTTSTTDMMKPVDFLYRYILKAVKR
jgi:CubicO group peptidase (beta-lactamase class C family)